MCKCPNYMIWEGEYSSYKRVKVPVPGESKPILPSDYITKLEYVGDKPKFKFLGHQPYDRMIELKSPWIEVPCGHCLECRIAQTRVWADRCVLEAKQYKYNYFVTLTYDDAHYPSNGSLVPEDLEKFIKAVRDQFRGIKIRYLACGEYGGKSGRAHYHIILFNCPLNDLTFRFRMMENGRLVTRQKPESVDGLQYSPLIHKCWQYKGMISVGAFNYDTASYVSQYCTKKVNPKNQEQYKLLGIVPEFLRVSTHPGIGAKYFEDHIDDELYSFDNIIVAGKGKAHVSSVPRYCDKLFIKKYGEDLFQPVRNKRSYKRLNNRVTYQYNDVDKDLQRERMDYHLHKVHQIKTLI